MINGVINVYKEPGFTSHDVVAKLRGILKQKKIGHMGTLDPNAVGVLPVCLGKATKLCDILSEKDKTYNATLLLGLDTDTQDTSGEVISKADTDSIMELSEDKVFETIKSYIGDYDQIPPMFSAIKIGGEKLYNLARRGEVIERPARHCRIIDITVTKMELPRVDLHVTCSKGTYIRTLCHDIGKDLGVGGCMEKLVRTKVERFSVEDSITLKQIEEFRDNNTLEDYITPVDEMLGNYSKCMVSKGAEKLVYNGNIFTSGNTFLKMNHEDGQIVRVYTSEGEFIGLYKFNSEKQIYKSVKMFL
ncbi:tRNA pseudouridine(55) synthase TruB [Eubacterium sp. BX4]|uniref:tRNA pseudouridine synthase B n=1 Tax=Eubacterium segne TaxID=2763045 RepID=A0ABR7F010_9FIRM|nr:tRNA pseudouridine(55) synthase TruB [Eubacterium segne]MBC5666939.1 tRNA pseudouridine(55) synthase TruB [Eubacterium segne]